MSSSTGLARAGDNAGAGAEPLLASALIAVVNITAVPSAGSNLLGNVRCAIAGDCAVRTRDVGRGPSALRRQVAARGRVTECAAALAPRRSTCCRGGAVPTRAGRPDSFTPGQSPAQIPARHRSGNGTCLCRSRR
jgi:hypothetical protein